MDIADYRGLDKMLGIAKLQSQQYKVDEANLQAS